MKHEIVGVRDEKRGQGGKDLGRAGRWKEGRKENIRTLQAVLVKQSRVKDRCSTLYSTNRIL